MAISENQTIVLKSYFPSHRGRCHRLHALHDGCAKSALFALDKDHNCILTFAEVIEMYVGRLLGFVPSASPVGNFSWRPRMR